MDQVWTWTGSGPELEKVYFIMVSAQVYFIDYETEVTCSLLGPSPGQKKCYRIKIQERPGGQKSTSPPRLSPWCWAGLTAWAVTPAGHLTDWTAGHLTDAPASSCVHNGTF